MAVHGKERVVSDAMLVFLQVEGGARHEPHAGYAAAQPLQLGGYPRWAVQLEYCTRRDGVRDAVVGIEPEEVVNLVAKVRRHGAGQAPEGLVPIAGAAILIHRRRFRALTVLLHGFVRLGLLFTFTNALGCLRRKVHPRVVTRVAATLLIDRRGRGYLGKTLGRWLRNGFVVHPFSTDALGPTPIRRFGTGVAGGLQVGRHTGPARVRVPVALAVMAGAHFGALRAALGVAVEHEVLPAECDRLGGPGGRSSGRLTARRIVRDNACLAVFMRVLVPGPSAHRLKRLEAPALSSRYPLNRAGLHHRLGFWIEDVVSGSGPMLAQPHALMPPGLKKDVVARAPGGLPAQPLAELQAVGARLLAKEARVRGAAVLPAEVLGENRGSMPNEPRESRMRAGEAPPDFLLQREEQHAQDALAELNAVLHDAVALVLVGRGRLLKDTATLQEGKTIPQG